MSEIVTIYAALMTISVIIVAVLAIAWFDFDRPRHVLTWMITFTLLGVDWALQFGAQSVPIDGGVAQALILTLRALAAATNTVGFRQRARRPSRAAWLIAATIPPSILAFGLQLNGSGTAGLAPLDLFDAVMLALAAITLVGRRRSERAAQNIAYCGLVVLSLISGVLAFARLHAMIEARIEGVTWMASAVLLLSPAMITAMGLVTIFLLAADQADLTRRLAATDMLTGLLNRRGFEEAASQLLDAARQSGQTASLALIDIDRLKAINDSFGHQAGDAVIGRFAAILAAQSGRRDLLARLGGEEFAMLMADTDLTAAACAAEVLRGSVAAAAFDLPDGRAVTASFGLVECDGRKSIKLADLIASADEALYRAKTEGRNRVMIADPSCVDSSGTAAR